MLVKEPNKVDVIDPYQKKVGSQKIKVIFDKVTVQIFIVAL